MDETKELLIFHEMIGYSYFYSYKKILMDPYSYDAQGAIKFTIILLFTTG